MRGRWGRVQFAWEQRVGERPWVWGVQAGFGSQPCWMRKINWCQTGRQMLNISLDLSKSVSSPEKWGCLLHRSVRIKSRQWTYCGEIIKRLLIDYVHPHLPLQFSLLCPPLGSEPWGKNVADQKEKEKKTKTKKHLPISAFGQWKGLEWDGKYGVILIAEKLMNVRILHVVTCIPPGRERLGIMWPRVTGSRSLHHLLDWWAGKPKRTLEPPEAIWP